MAALESNIKSLNNKLQQLLKEYQSLQKSNAKLIEDIGKLKGEKETYNKQIEQLQIQVGVLKTAAGNMDTPEKKEFEKKISGYIKEIDKCITLLS